MGRERFKAALRRQRLFASGYVDCACRDCFDVAVSSGGPALCSDCRAAGCDASGHSECQRTDNYAQTMATEPPPVGWLVRIESVGWVRVESSSPSQVSGRRVDGGGSWQGKPNDIIEARRHFPTGSFPGWAS
jgi:hypothetical protein